MALHAGISRYIINWLGSQGQIFLFAGLHCIAHGDVINLVIARGTDLGFHHIYTVYAYFVYVHTFAE